MTFWLDVCPGDGRLVALGDESGSLKIFDRRISKVANILSNIHSSNVRCLRWDPSSTRLASTSDDKTAKVTDAKTGKAVYIESSPEKSNIKF